MASTKTLEQQLDAIAKKYYDFCKEKMSHPERLRELNYPIWKDEIRDAVFSSCGIIDENNIQGCKIEISGVWTKSGNPEVFYFDVRLSPQEFNEDGEELPREVVEYII